MVGARRAANSSALPVLPPQPWAAPEAGGGLPNRRGAASAGEVLVSARGCRVTPYAMNKRTGWENEATTRAINAEPWEPMPGMVKRQCPDCHALVRRSGEQSPWSLFAARTCVEKLPRGRPETRVKS